LFAKDPKASPLAIVLHVRWRWHFTCPLSEKPDSQLEFLKVLARVCGSYPAILRKGLPRLIFVNFVRLEFEKLV